MVLMPSQCRKFDEISEARQCANTRKIVRLRLIRGPSLKMIETIRKRLWNVGAPKKFFGFRSRETGKARRLEVSGNRVGGFDRARHPFRQNGRQSEPLMNGAKQAHFECLVIEADGGLERTDEIPDHVFGCIVQQRGEPFLISEIGVERGRDVLDEQRVLRDRKRVPADRLPVPPRNARQAMRDVFELYIAGAWRKKIETPPGEHALPGARAQIMVSRRGHRPGTFNFFCKPAHTP